MNSKIIENAHRVLTVLSLSAIAVGSSAFASDEMIPYIAPSHCGSAVKQPPNSGPVFYSKNCQYALVGPSTRAEMKLLNFVPSMNILRCRSYQAHMETVEKTEAILARFNERLDALQQANASPVEIDKQTQRVQVLSKTAQELRSSYAGIEAARAQIEFDSGQPEEQMAAYRELNSTLIDLTHIVIVRAPISTGYISMANNTVSAETAKSDPAILSSSIPGLRTSQQQDSTVVMNGSIAGQAVLSLNGACALLQDYNYKMPINAKADPSKLTSLMTANYSYAIPVQSGVEYSAHLNVNNAINAISEQKKTSGQFSLSGFYNLNLKGTSTEWCTVDITRYELPTEDMFAKATFENQLNGTVCTNLASRLKDRLELTGFLKGLETAAGTAAPEKAGGNRVTYGTRQECHSTQAFGFSVPGLSGCQDVQYQILNWTDGISAQKVELSDTTHFDEAESMHLNSTLKRWFTTAFVPETQKLEGVR